MSISTEGCGGRAATLKFLFVFLNVEVLIVSGDRSLPKTVPLFFFVRRVIFKTVELNSRGKELDEESKEPKLVGMQGGRNTWGERG